MPNQYNIFLKCLLTKPLFTFSVGVHHIKTGNVENTENKLPVLVSSNQTYSVVKGENAVLECNVENLGKFVVLWRQGERILTVGRLLVRKDGKVGVGPGFGLVLTEVQESDAGQYECQVDVFGHAKTVCHTLHVLGE